MLSAVNQDCCILRVTETLPVWQSARTQRKARTQHELLPGIFLCKQPDTRQGSSDACLSLSIALCAARCDHELVVSSLSCVALATGALAYCDRCSCGLRAGSTRAVVESVADCFSAAILTLPAAAGTAMVKHGANAKGAAKPQLHERASVWHNGTRLCTACLCAGFSLGWLLPRRALRLLQRRWRLLLRLLLPALPLRQVRCRTTSLHTADSVSRAACDCRNNNDLLGAGSCKPTCHYLFCCCCACTFAAEFRRELRAKYNLAESPCSDSCACL